MCVTNMSAGSERANTACDFRSVPARVTLQAERTPEATAVSSSAGSLTYQQLNQRAAKLASRLRSLGVGPDVLVAICLPRSIAMVVAALAVLKAGGAYLPIDPADPPQRIRFLLADAIVRVLLAAKGAATSEEGLVEHVIVLNELGCDVAASPYPTVKSKPASRDLAYVIYTSGSTGEPKGVEVTHGGLSNLIEWHQQTFKVSAEDRATQLARVSFDATVWEVWPYLTQGASIHIPPEHALTDPEGLRDWLIDHEITISFVPTPMAERLLDLQWPLETKLRTMLTGGDVLHHYPRPDLPFILVNNYGPTECTVVATSCLVSACESSKGLPPIGSPIANTHLYVLDEAGQPVPEGERGELYIGGHGVARGYRGRPELSAQKFVRNPFEGNGYGRLYRTGDLVQKLAGGQLAFVGRADEQIKVRGFRVEPHEIVAALDAHPAICQSAVIARAFNSAEPRLIAYIVLRRSQAPQVSQLREFIGARLPDYMVPEVFVQLDRLPLSANGKVDRAAFPSPNNTNILSDEVFAVPESEVQKLVAEILARLLGLKQVDIHANFFALGGHS